MHDAGGGTDPASAAPPPSPGTTSASRGSLPGLRRPSPMLTTWWNTEPGVGVPPARRQATAIYAARADARARIAEASPTLQHSESWFETLVSLHEYLPPGIWWFVNALTCVITLLDIWFAGDGAGFDGDTWWRIPSHAHNTLLGLLSLLLAFRTAQAYDRWWEARKLWGQVRRG